MTLEEVLEITNQIENIDGDDVYILHREIYKEVDKLKQRIKKEKEDHMFSMLSKDMEFIENSNMSK
ncbi:MAG: hypothetical protein HFI48_04605 [Lachnospiraceae bacterium]|nr:hypothetical protein [Lachnospiraceae bacterium]